MWVATLSQKVGIENSVIQPNNFSTYKISQTRINNSTLFEGRY